MGLLLEYPEAQDRIDTFAKLLLMKEFVPLGEDDLALAYSAIVLASKPDALDELSGWYYFNYGETVGRNVAEMAQFAGQVATDLGLDASSPVVRLYVMGIMAVSPVDAPAAYLGNFMDSGIQPSTSAGHKVAVYLQVGQKFVEYALVKTSGSQLQVVVTTIDYDQQSTRHITAGQCTGGFFVTYRDRDVFRRRINLTECLSVYTLAAKVHDLFSSLSGDTWFSAV